MTRTIFPLLLAVAGLAMGCNDASPEERTASRPLPKLEAPKKREVPKEVEQVAMPALTAVAPEQPKSIADVKEEPKTVEMEPLAIEVAHDSAPEQMFDRALDAKEVVIDRFVLAKDVSGREPVEESDHFPSDNAKIFAFVQLANAADPYAITVHFEPVDGPPSLYGVKLDVRSAPRFRTWAWTKLVHTPGKYRAVLRTLEGEEIAAREFTIDEPTTTTEAPELK